jgi:hypothetical protein
MNNQDRTISIIALILLIPLAVWGYFYWKQYGDTGLNYFLGGLVTLSLYSILYRENPIYRFVEHVYLGLAAGYGVVIIWTQVLRNMWYDPIVKDGQWLWLWVLPLAILAYFVFSRKHSWMARIPLVILSGFAAGQTFQAFAQQYFPQIRNSFKPLKPTMTTLINPNPSPDTLSISGAINNIIFMLTLLAVLTYFLFSFEQKHKGIKKLALSGRWLIMIGFGAIFGSTIMTRFALLVDRMYFILIEWLRIKPA